MTKRHKAPRKKITTGHRSNLKQLRSLMKPIKFAVTSLIPCRHDSNQSVTSSDSELISRMEMRLLACVTRGPSWELNG